ncbi:MAG: CsgG/HfaB family protein, partial [Planctomycetota bacterium]
MNQRPSTIYPALLAVLTALAWLIPSGDAGPASQSRPANRDPAATAPVRRALFAAPFDNATGQEQYDPAAAGMGDLVAVMLARQPKIRVMERQRLRLLTAEQALSLKGLTGRAHAVAAGRILRADTVLTGRLYLIGGKLTVNAKAIDIATERVMGADQVSCRPVDLPEAALQLAQRLARRMALPLPKVDLKQIDTSPIASLHFAKALGH